MSHIDMKNLTNKEKQNLYKKQFMIVREELNKVDILGVILNNPNFIDEYDLENEFILPHLRNIKDEFELAKKIAEIFVNSCNINTNPTEWLDCSKNILNKINNIKD